TVRVANGCTVKDGRVIDARVPRRFLPGVQVVEYLRAFLFGRLGWNRLGGSLVISGAFGLFRKEYLLAIGGYRLASIVEDMDLVVRLHRYLRQRKIPYEISFIPDPVAWTEVPESGRILGRQRERWHRGLIAAMWQYKTMLFNPRYGRVGLLAVPFFTLGEMLAPLVELLGYVVTIVGLAYGIINVSFALLFLVVAWGYGMLLSLWAVGLEAIAEAAGHFAAADSLCPGSPAARTGLGFVRLRQGDAAAAERSFTTALRGDSSEADAWFGLGLARNRLGRRADAIPAWRRALAIAPGYSDALDALLAAGVDSGLPLPPRARPPAPAVPARVTGERFEVRAGDDWKPFYVKGVNLGV